MKRVLVDTSVWSLALRKKEWTKEEQRVVDYLSKLISNLKVVLIGPLRQEILSGISQKEKFDLLKEKLSIFEDHAIDTHDFELAAEFYNECRHHGIQGSHIDYLLSAFAVNHDLKIFTLDKVFQNYKEYLNIQLENFV